MYYKELRKNNYDYFSQKIYVYVATGSQGLQGEIDPTTDIVFVGLRQNNTDNIYVGVGEWVYNGEPVELHAHGIVAVTDTNTLYELANLGNSTIYLSTPDIRDLSTKSYFANPLVTLVVTYLGK